jgi:hypothetical protein
MTQLSTSIQPLAQTFNVSEDDGVFITKIGLFFSGVSTTLPVSIELRNAFLGSPTMEMLPGSSVTKTKTEMASAASATAATETVFTFEEPIYLHGGKTYAFVIKTNATNEYKVWTSRVGDYKVGTTQEKVTRQIETGVMFKSQGGLRYGAEAQSDIKFKLYRAAFTASTGLAVFQDDNPPRVTLGTNPFYAKAADSDVYVTHPNHGFQINDKVLINDVSGTVNGVPSAKLNGTRTITAIDGTGYKFALPAVTLPQTAAVSYGGTGITASTNYQMDTVQIQVQDFVPSQANLFYQAHFTKSKSFAGGETAGTYTKNVELINQRDHHFDNPHVILSDSNEGVYGAISQSTKVTARMLGIAGNDTISPVIDVQRAQLLTINNLIDKPNVNTTTGYNVPLTFVADSDAVGGSALASHITKPVRLANGATGVKVLFGGHRMDGSEFDLYYRTTLTGTDSDILAKPFTLETVDNTVPNDTNKEMFHEYVYTIGGDYAKDLPEFDQYQLKIVMTGDNSSSVPRIKDLRTIAVA